MKSLIQFRLVQTFTRILNSFSFAFSTWIARRVGDVLYVFMRKRRTIALQNIARAFGDKLPLTKRKLIARAAFQHVCIALMELFNMKKMTALAAERFEFKGKENAEEAFSKGKGALLVISHLGSWEYLAFLPYLTGQPWSVIVRDIRNQFLDKRVNDLRRMTTLNPISKKNSVRAILHELKKNRGVAILIDQWAGSEGVWVDFFGVPTSTTSIPARLAKRTGCALVPAYCLRTRRPGYYEIHIEPPIYSGPESAMTEEEITRLFNQRLEEKIRAYPSQWLWTHRRWKKCRTTYGKAPI